MEQDFLEDRPTNHREDANFLSALLFWWTFKIFNLGKKRDLFESDLPEPLKEHKASTLGDKISRLWSIEIKRQQIPSLTRVLTKCFFWEYFAYGLALAFMELIVKPTQPLFIGLLVRYFTAENSQNTNPEAFPMYLSRMFYYNHPNQCAIQRNEAILYASCIVLCSIASVIFQHPYMLSVMHIGMKIRVACTSLMYRKTLRMSMLALSPTTVGNVVNLMSNDATRFDIVTMFLHYLWISPIQMIMFTYILYTQVGIAAYVGAGVIAIFIPVQMILAYLNKNLRWKTAFKTDERVRLMNEIIAGIQVIKMYAWEYAFCKLVNVARRREMGILVRTSYIRGLVMSMIMFTSRTAIFVTLTSFVLLFGNTISSEKVFIVIGYYMIMRSSMTLFFPQGITQFAEAIITIKRTRDYLMNEEAIVGDPSILNPDLKDSSTETNFSISLVKQELPTVPSIRIIEAYARWNKNHYVLRDIEFSIGQNELVVFLGRVGSGKTSLLHVILKELPLCRGYISVKGTISYASQEPWLFAGSVRINILFGEVYDRERYRNVCSVCALQNDFKMLPYGDQTIVGERGISLSGGQRARVNLARCIYKKADIYIMDDPLSAVDTHVGAQIFEECIMGFLKNKIRILVTHQSQYLQRVDHMIVLEKGRVVAKGTYHELHSSGLNFTQFAEEHSSEKLATPSIHDIPTSSSLGYFSEINVRQSFIETRGTGQIGCTLYKQYLRAGGNCCWIIWVVSMFLLTQGLASASDFFVAKWVNIEELNIHRDEPGFEGSGILSANDCIISYAVVTDLLIMASIGRSFLFFYLCLRGSIKLHDEMFESIVFGQMRFFNMNPSGRILNRFSKDMGSVDEDLPYAMIDFSQMFLNLIGATIILSATNYYLLPPIILITTALVLIRRYYLKTSRSLKRVEGVVRSAVFAHLNASIQGLSTIRTHRAEEILTYEFDKHMDLHSSAWYLFISTARAFSLWMDGLCVALITLASYGFILLQTVFNMDVMAGDVGLCITQCISLTGLIPWGMRQSAEMENQMTSVERIIDFTNIDHEPDLLAPKELRPPANWPSDGEIIFKETTLRYSLREEPVLKDLNFVIRPKEKIGIVGRTGAGKSSLISALFRLAYQSGSIIIDGIDIFNIGLHDVRRKIAIIPQEPVIFTGTMRFNLDPFRTHSDEVLLSALSTVDLEPGTRNILNQSLVEGGASLSAGEKQLLCLARAIVRNCRILILDEATSNMDAETDRLIQKTIRTSFDQCTVLTIAHRLYTIMDYDRVLVMHAGAVVEFDHPHNLLQIKDGYFTSMVNQTGKQMAQVLKKIAEDNFKNNGPSILAALDQIHESFSNPKDN
ncbi:uncharacterized protein CBL_06477 [Carabus blaptoides fortunei]